MLSLNWHWPVGRLNWLFFFFFFFFFFSWIRGPFPSPPPLLHHSSSPLRASWERWAQTAGLVKDPSWDADNVFFFFAHRLPCSPLASASLIRTQNSTRNGYLFLSCFFPPPPFVELFLSAIPLIQRNNESQVGQDNAAARQCLSLGADWQQHGGATGLFKYALWSFPLTLSKWLKVGGAATSSLPPQCKPISGFVWAAEPSPNTNNFFFPSSTSSARGFSYGVWVTHSRTVVHL